MLATVVNRCPLSPLSANCCLHLNSFLVTHVALVAFPWLPLESCVAFMGVTWPSIIWSMSLSDINVSCYLSHAPPELIEATKPSRGNETLMSCPTPNPCTAPSNALLLYFPRQPSHGIEPMALHPHAQAFVMHPCRHKKKEACMSWSPWILLSLPFMFPSVP